MTVVTQLGFVRSAAMMAAVRELQDALQASGGVLLSGERATGRRQFARAIHLVGDGPYTGSIETLLRKAMVNRQPNGRPFVEFDCANARAVEHELFGCSASPTGDGVERIAAGSALHRAFGGTLVLNEVHELPARVQARLARVLRDGEVLVADPHGGTGRNQTTSLRAIGTSQPSHDADRLVPELQARLCSAVINLPPLRKRGDDIPALARYTLADVCDALNLPAKTLSKQASELLSALPWRGNMEEMRALMRMFVLRVPGPVIRQADVLRHVRLDGRPTMPSYVGPLKEARERFEREYVAAVLEQHKGRMAEAAKALGIQRTNLYRKVRQLAVRRPRKS